MSEEESQTFEFVVPINEILARFPVIGQTIFDFLDDQSLKRSREVDSAWSSFLIQNSFYWIRMAKSYLEGQDEFSDDWKNIFKKIPLEIARKFALGIAHIHRSEPKHEHKGTYSSLSESPKLGCLNPGYPLQFAAIMGHVDIFKYFFERVEVKNSQDDYGQMPIHWAAGNGNLEICKYIHEKGDCLCTQVNDGTMPIHLAAMSGNLETFKLIYEEVEEKNPQDNSGWMPIHFAAHRGHLEICKYIHEKGNSLIPRDNFGTTPLTWAAMIGHFAVCQFIFGVVGQTLTQAQKAEVATLLKSNIDNIFR